MKPQQASIRRILVSAEHQEWRMHRIGPLFLSGSTWIVRLALDSSMQHSASLGPPSAGYNAGKSIHNCVEMSVGRKLVHALLQNHLEHLRW